MLRCYFAALSKNTVAAAIAWPARTRCQRGHQERKRSCVARVSTVGARESTRADFLKKTSTSACSFYDSTVKNILGCSTRNDKFKRCFYDSTIKYTWLQYKTPQIQAPGTTFSFFGDEVGVQGGHGNCCRFATLAGVHQGAHICLTKLWIHGKIRS